MPVAHTGHEGERQVLVAQARCWWPALGAAASVVGCCMGCWLGRRCWQAGRGRKCPKQKWHPGGFWWQPGRDRVDVEADVAGEALGAGWSQSWGPAGDPRGLWGHLKDLHVSGRWGEGGPKQSTRTVSSCDLRAGMGQRATSVKDGRTRRIPIRTFQEGPIAMDLCHREKALQGVPVRQMACAMGSLPRGQGKGALCGQDAI